VIGLVKHRVRRRGACAADDLLPARVPEVDADAVTIDDQRHRVGESLVLAAARERASSSRKLDG